jgi:signal transduction histidine kinase
MSQEALRLVLLNLASNAVKHAAPNSDISVVASRADGDISVSVTNVGDPITPEAAARVFEPFVQAEGSARTAEGVGLGLHIVDKLVSAHGGEVKLDNGPDSVTFTIRLPEARRAEGPPSVDVTEEAGAAL